jgi:putative copper export protein
MLAAIRPDSWNYALFLHVLGAAVLVGALVTAGTAQVLGWARDASGGTAMFARLSFRTLLFVAVPAWFAMRIGAEWIYSNEPDWLGVGYMTADLGGILLLVSVVLAGFGARRLARADSGSNALARSAGIIALVVLALYLVALWAMTAKPS